MDANERELTLKKEVFEVVGCALEVILKGTHYETPEPDIQRRVNCLGNG